MSDAELELEAELEKLMTILAESDLESEAESEAAHPAQPGGQAKTSRDQSVAAAQISRGVRDENKLTDAVFDDRHPEWTGKLLTSANAALRREWIQIRDVTIRPLLKRSPAIQQPKVPVAAPSPVPPAPATTLPNAGNNTFGFSTFDNIQQYRPDLYQAALAAQTAYGKVSGFLHWYQKIMIAVPQVSISESDQGIGNLVFSMSSRALTDLVEDDGLRGKVLEMAASGLSELVFTEDVIGVLGLGLTLLDIARGIENHQKLGSFGTDHDMWVKKQQFQFVFALVAEDLSRRNWGNGYFYSRDPRDLAVELANRFAEFKPIFDAYTHYFWLDGDLGKYHGNIPTNIPPSMKAAD